MMAAILSLLTPFWGYIATAIAGLTAVAGMWLKAKADGAAQERAKEIARIVLAEQAVVDARKSVDAKTDDKVREELSKWAKS